MAIFEIKTATGTYQVKAPDQDTALRALGAAPPPAPTEEMPDVYPPPPDKYQQAALEDVEKAKKAGIGSSPWQRRIMQGATFNAADEVLAGLQTPFEMIRRGTFNPAEGYRYAKAREDAILEDARKETGGWGTAAEILGGVGSGLGVGRSALSLGSRLAPNAGLMARTGASAADAAALGGVSGAMEGNGLGERAKNALTGAAVGGAVGGATPGAVALGSKVLAPFTSNWSAWRDPAGYAQSQLARGLTETGRATDDIADDVARAAAEGQPMYTLADAMGNPGQRQLSAVARSPGRGRTEVVEFLENRQAGQGRRVAGALAEGFNAPQTAAQAREAMTRGRDAAADIAYPAVRQGAGSVDLSRTIARIDETLRPGVNQIVNPGSNIANDSIEAALQGVRSRLTDGRSILTDFTAVQRIRGDLADAVQEALRRGQGNRARLLRGVLREMDDAMENASAGFRQANANFAQASRDIDAIDLGRNAATRGRPEDTIPLFRAQAPGGQQGFRSGYADTLIQGTQGAQGVNKARPLTDYAFQEEAAVMAPGAPLMGRRIGRENTMFETRNHALGGSRTADNLADDGAMGIDPTLMGQLATGQWRGAAQTALRAGQNVFTGNTPAVREEMARLLLQRGGNVTQAELRRILGQALANVQRRSRMASQLGRGLAGGMAVTPSAAQ